MSKKTKIIICALAFGCVLACCVFAYAARANIAVSLAEREIDNNDYAGARVYAEKFASPETEILLLYIDLRMDINRKFPVMLKQFDVSVVESWKKTADFLGVNEEGLLKEDFAFESQRISKTLSGIIKANSEYSDLRGDILDFMDLFAELGRLHSRVDGRNVSFTVAQESKKLDRWRETYNTLADYTGKYLGGGSSYLLSYLIGEAGAEFTTIQNAFDIILQSGYSADDVIRYNDEVHTVYPDITSQNGVAVNLLDKVKYEEHLYKDICSCLVSLLAEFYAVKG